VTHSECTIEPTEKIPAAGSVLSDASFETARQLAQELTAAGVWKQAGEKLHRLSPVPFPLESSEVAYIRNLGKAVWSFYKALNQLYLWKGHDWAKEWLDQGKPSWLIDLARMNYSKQHLPRLLRPDLILGDGKMWVTELDSVPGGAGDTATMSQFYEERGMSVLGGRMGIPESFARVVNGLAQSETWNLAIVVSDESEDYRAEMTALAGQLRMLGHNAWCVHPRDVLFDEEGLWLSNSGARERIDVMWRFFELFDLRNISKSELFAYASKKKKVVVSPPFKPFMEEKLALGLLHHALLSDFWMQQMGDHFTLLRNSVPKTWIMDPTPVPKHCEIAGLQYRGKPVRDFRELADATQKERRLVIKPSGFSPLAWGSRGVVVGHDVSQEEWADAIDNALASFSHTPYILQEFHEGRRLDTPYWDPSTGRHGKMHGRARLSPYYYAVEDEPHLAGVLATICPDNKKLIHGMSDAVMTVCAEENLDRV